VEYLEALVIIVGAVLVFLLLGLTTEFVTGGWRRLTTSERPAEEEGRVGMMEREEEEESRVEMSERGDARYCPQCGQEVGAEDRFCRSCGRHLSVPPLGEGRIEPGRATLPPPVPTTPSYGGGGGFLHSFGLGAGGCIGFVVAALILLGGCAAIFGGSGGG
jgi:hypothetical protein